MNIREWIKWKFGFALRVRRALRAMDALMKYDLSKEYGFGWPSIISVELYVVDTNGGKRLLLGTPGKKESNKAAYKKMMEGEEK